MAYADVRRDFLACSQRGAPSRMPVLAFTCEFHQQQAGLTHREARLDVVKAVDCQVEGSRRYDEDWAIVFPDDYVEFEPLGMPMRDSEHQPTMPIAYLPFDRPTLGRFRIPDAKREMRLPIHLEMLRRLKDRVGDEVLVMGRIAAPFSAIALVYGIEELMVGTITQPELIRDNLRFFIDHQIAFGKAQLESGADLLWLGDCCASSKFCSLDCCCEFAFEAAAEVASALRAAGGLLIYHTGDAAPGYLAREAQLPVHALNVGEGCRLADLKKAVDRKICLMGNFDPVLLRDGSPEAVARSAAEMVRENLPGGGYIFDTGEGVMCNSPAANVKAMFDAVRTAAAQAGPAADAGS